MRLKAIVTILVMSVIFAGCTTKEPDSSQGTQQSENEELELTYEAISGDDLEQKSWDEIVSLYGNNINVYNVNKTFNSETTDLSKWYLDYDGSDFQIIPNNEHVSSTVRNRRDVVYYRTDETDVQKVLQKMLSGLVDTLMKVEEGRPYTITKYELDEKQPVVQVNENVWILLGIEGFYKYTGTDMGTMEEIMPHETDIKDGMIRFFAQGSSATSQYILIYHNGVYRLEYADNMGSFGIEYY